MHSVAAAARSILAILRLLVSAVGRWGAARGSFALQRWSRIEDRAFEPERVALYAAALLAGYAIFMAAGYFRRLWLVDTGSAGMAIDFVAAWAAGHLALAGRAADAYDLAALTREQMTVVASINGSYPWPYPPTYFLLAAPLAAFPYTVAALVWIVATFTAYLAAIHAILPRRSAVLAAAASPFVLWSMFTGQNGFLTAALIGGTLACLDRRPILAGILLGCLTLKPQLGILFPVMLVLTGRWRVFGAAAVTTLLLAAASYLVFGAETWRAFFVALQTQSMTVLGGGVPFYKQQSVFALVRVLGGGVGLAWVLHAAAALAAAVFTGWLWRQPVDQRLKSAALATAALIATPYLFLYDLPNVSVPVAFLASLGIARGFIPGERTVIALLMPTLLFFTATPLGVPLLAGLMLLIVLRLRMTPAADANVATA